MKKKREIWSKQNYTVASRFAVFCYDDTQREIVRRIAASTEHQDALRLDAAVTMERGRHIGLAMEWADAQTALIAKIGTIIDEVLEEERKAEEAKEEEK